jgi:hypothetical protein
MIALFYAGWEMRQAMRLPRHARAATRPGLRSPDEFHFAVKWTRREPKRIAASIPFDPRRVSATYDAAASSVPPTGEATMNASQKV